MRRSPYTDVGNLSVGVSDDAERFGVECGDQLSVLLGKIRLLARGAEGWAPGTPD